MWSIWSNNIGYASLMFHAKIPPPTQPITMILFLWHQTNALIGIPTFVFFKALGVIFWGWVYNIEILPAKSPIATRDPSSFIDSPQLVI